jgi:hypothetical protein
MMDSKDNIPELSDELKKYGFPILQKHHSYAELLQALSYHINQLITTDFPTLVQLLYRLDISEQQVRTALKDTTTNLASNSIAELIIQRQQKKLEMRKLFRKDDNIPEDERW